MSALPPMLLDLMRLIAAGETGPAMRMLNFAPDLAMARLEGGASRAEAGEWRLSEIEHYVYAGDTALHVAAAAYRTEIAGRLIELGADVGARNRRGAAPLHYAADGIPAARAWNPAAQAKTVALLIQSGADPNTKDMSGVAPLHRAVRTRCAAAVEALLAGGADARLANKAGSTPLQLAGQPTGRGGSGSVEAKAQQAEILRLLARVSETA